MDLLAQYGDEDEAAGGGPAPLPTAALNCAPSVDTTGLALVRGAVAAGSPDRKNASTAA